MLNNSLNYMMQLLTKDIRFSPSRARVRRKLARQLASAAQNRVDANGRPRCTAFSVEGVLTAGQNTSFAVGGEDIVIDAATWVLGNISVGSSVTVSGYMRNGGELYAKKIIVGN